MALDRLAFVGEYKLEKALVGTCPKEIHVEKDAFANQTSSPSLGFYCELNSEGCSSPVVYQLPDINSGKIREVLENPMTGAFDSVHYSHQTLIENKLTAENKLTSIFGQLYWKMNFKAKLEGKKLSYQFSEINNIVNEDTQSSCIYSRK